MSSIIQKSHEFVPLACLEAEKLFQQGQFSKVLPIFSQLSKEFPENGRISNNLAATYWETGNISDALRMWNDILLRSPQNLDATINLGEAHLSLDDEEKALEVYFRAMDQNIICDDLILHLNKAQIKYTEKKVQSGHILNTKYKVKDYLISVIISTYDSEEFMEECLSDILAQSIIEKIEIVIVDANSPGKENDIVKRFQEKYDNILYIKTQDRIGIYPAWNIAISLSSGKYIFPFSTNDRLYSKALEILSSELEKDPSTALVYGNSYLTDLPHQEFSNHKTTNYANGKFNWPEYNYIDLLFNCRVGPHPMWRRELHEKIGYFDPKYKAIGDQDFWLRIGRNNKMKHIMDYTGLAWITPDSLSGKEESRQEIFEIQKKHQDIYRMFGNKSGKFPGGGGSYFRTLKLKYGVSDTNFSMGQLLHQLQHHIQVENQEIILKTIVSILGSSEVSKEIYDILIDLLQNMNLGNEILFFLGTILEREPANAKAWEVIKSKFPEFS